MISKYSGGVVAGGAAGLLVGGTVALTAMLERTGVADGAQSWVHTFDIAVLMAGTAGGAVLGPAALRAQGDHVWIGIIAQLAIIAVILGAIVVAFPIAFEVATASESSLVPWVTTLLRSWIGLAAGGALVLGLPALLLTLPPAGAWAVVMAMLRGRLAR